MINRIATAYSAILEKDGKKRGGGGHEHSEKAERMAEHIEESEEKRGVFLSDLRR
jgi:hypothetical protein